MNEILKTNNICHKCSLSIVFKYYFSFNMCVRESKILPYSSNRCDKYF